MSFSNPVAKSVGADGTAPGRVWESRLLPALITLNQMMVGGVLCVPDGARAPHPPFFCFVCLFYGVRGCVWGGVCCTRGTGGCVWGLCGVVDVADELLCFVDQGVAEESGTGQQHQHNTSPPVRDTSRA